MISFGYVYGGVEEVLILINDFLLSEFSYEILRVNFFIIFCLWDGVYCVYYNEL